MKIYLIPGLGYDSRIFENLDFGDLEVNYFNWIEPKLNESFHDYAIRLFEDLPQDDKNIVLIGHSLGGMIAQEIAMEKTIHKIILISSIRMKDKMPLMFRMIKPLGLYHFPIKIFSIKTVRFWGRFHDFAKPAEQTLFKSMVGKQSNHYLQWALKLLAAWKAPTLPTKTSTFQIHGTKDKNFPISLMNQPDIIIENGSHNMVYTEGKKISAILKRVI